MQEVATKFSLPSTPAPFTIFPCISLVSQIPPQACVPSAPPRYVHYYHTKTLGLFFTYSLKICDKLIWFQWFLGFMHKKIPQVYFLAEQTADFPLF